MRQGVGLGTQEINQRLRERQEIVMFSNIYVCGSAKEEHRVSEENSLVI